MTIKADRDKVCWEIIDSSTGANYHADDDYWPHYLTRRDCAEAIAELHRDVDLSIDEPLQLVARPCFTRPCVILVCDGCGYVFDEDEHKTHLDPGDPFPLPISDYDWRVEHRAGQPDRHYCPGDECAASVCEDCEERHHGGCPDPAWLPVPVTEGQLTLLGGDT